MPSEFITDFTTEGAQETIAFGIQLGKEAKKNTLFCLHGNLGAGKTTLIKGIIHGATGTPLEKIHSPTYVYLNEYGSEKGKMAYHFDLYRLKDEKEFLSLGFEEYFYRESIVCIEWSERILPLLPTSAISIHLSHSYEDQRHIRMYAGKELSV
jgi:tRNA threonylcarbamoyladenosine biosynthesis protein TsaE